MNSNWNLRFPRTYREATGQECHFARHGPDRIVGLVFLFALGLVLGLLLGEWA